MNSIFFYYRHVFSVQPQVLFNRVTIMSDTEECANLSSVEQLCPVFTPKPRVAQSSSGPLKCIWLEAFTLRSVCSNSVCLRSYLMTVLSSRDDRERERYRQSVLCVHACLCDCGPAHIRLRWSNTFSFVTRHLWTIHQGTFASLSEAPGILSASTINSQSDSDVIEDALRLWRQQSKKLHIVDRLLCAIMCLSSAMSPGCSCFGTSRQCELKRLNREKSDPSSKLLIYALQLIGFKVWLGSHTANKWLELEK